MTPAQIAIWTDERVGCGAIVWRFRGRTELTIVVKATYAIVADGPATASGPGEILADDLHPGNNPIRSPLAPSDLAPYLARCDVLFTGHAHVYGAPASAATVRLGLARDGRPLLDKTLHVFGDRGPSGEPQPFARMPLVYERALGPEEANPIGTPTPNVTDPKDARRPAGFGPIGRAWLSRRKLLGAADPKVLDAPIATVPDGIAWDYFQAAPADQQIAHLVGGEWLLLEGLLPARPRVQTRLPATPPIVRLVSQRPDGPPVERAVALVCDTVLVDGDRQRVTLTWRARYPLAAGESALAALRIVAQLTPGASAKPPENPLAALAKVGAATMAIPLPSREQLRPALPFGGRTPEALGTTAVGVRPASSPALPFASVGPVVPDLRSNVAPAAGAFSTSRTAVDTRPNAAAATPWDAAPIIAPPRAEEEIAIDTLPMGAAGLVVDDLAPASSVEPPPAVAEIAAPPPAAPALRSSPPPRDVWAPAPAPPPLPPTPVAAPRPFERPLAASMKSALYAKFARDDNRR